MSKLIVDTDEARLTFQDSTFRIDNDGNAWVKDKRGNDAAYVPRDNLNYIITD